MRVLRGQEAIARACEGLVNCRRLIFIDFFHTVFFRINRRFALVGARVQWVNRCDAGGGIEDEKKPVFGETKIDRRRIPTAPLRVEISMY